MNHIQKQQEIFNFVQANRLPTHNTESIILESKNLLKFMEMADYQYSVDVRLCLDVIRVSHLMHLDSTQPEYIFDLLLDDIPDDLDDLDDCYEQEKKTRSEWLKQYDGKWWILDNFFDLLESVS